MTGDAQLDHPIHNTNRVSRNIHDGGHLFDLACADIELGTMPGTGDVVTIQCPFADGAIIVGAYVVDRKVAARDIEDDNRLALNFNEEALARRQLRGRSDVEVLHLRFFKRPVVEHVAPSEAESAYSTRSSPASPRP